MQVYWTRLLIGAAALLVACDDAPAARQGPPGEQGPAGENGEDGRPCEPFTRADGTHGIACSGTEITFRDGDDGPSGSDGVDGSDGISCSVADLGDGVKQIACTDGTVVTVTDGEHGADGSSCSVRYVGRGMSEISCPDGTSALLETGFQSAIVAGDWHTCALKRDGFVSCWGRSDAGQTTAPEEVRFERLSASGNHTCGIDTEGKVRCWGQDVWSAGAGGLPEGTFRELAVAGRGGCALSDDGAVRCWGDAEGCSRDVEPGSASLSAFDPGSHGGDYRVCLVAPSERPHCWSSEGWESADDDWKAGRVLEMARDCARYEDGSVACASASIELGPQRALDVDAEGQLCGLDEAGRIACVQAERTVPEGSFVDLAVGLAHGCGLRSDGSVVCAAKHAGLEGLRATIPDGEAFVDLVAGVAGACAIRADGTVKCFGGLDQYADPDGSFVQVSIGSRHACGLRPEGLVECWGDSAAAPDVGDVVVGSIAALDHAVCGTVEGGAEDGGVRCWGFLGGNQATEGRWFAPPPGRRFEQVVAGGNDTVCALDDESRLRCFVSGEPFSNAALQEQIVEEVWPGSMEACARLPAGDIVCTGVLNQGIPEQTDFEQLSVGLDGVCGLYVDGQVACWGGPRDSLGHVPVAGPFSQVAVGYMFACGLRPAGSIDCWGYSDYGQATPPPELQ